MRKAVDLIVESAKPITAERGRGAREALDADKDLETPAALDSGAAPGPGTPRPSPLLDVSRP